MKLARRSSSLGRTAHLLVAVPLLLAAAPAHAGPPARGSLGWAEAWSTPGGAAEPLALATTLGGNTIVAGNFTQSIDFGGGALVSAGGAAAPGDLFVAELDAHGAALWSERFGDAADDHLVQAAATDLAGNVYLAGYFTGAIDFGGGPLVATVDAPASPYGPGRDAFLVKLDHRGKHLWSKRLGGPGLQEANAVAVDLVGNVTVGGAFTGTADFGGGPRVCAGDCQIADGSSNGFVATYDAWGHPLSDTEISSDPAGTSAVTAIAVDVFGTITVAGAFTGTAHLGGETRVGSGAAPSVLVARLGHGGSVRWSHAYGAGAFDAPTGLAVDLQGDVVVYGVFSDTLDFGGGPLVATDTFAGSGPSYFLAKLDGAGEHVWSKAFGTTGIVTSGNVAVDLAGDVAITGGYAGSIDFGGGPVAGGLFFPAAFVAAFDRDGGALWSQVASSDGNFFSFHAGAAVGFDLAGDVTVAGTVSGTLDFGGGPLVTGSITDPPFETTGAFVARFHR